MNVKSMIGINSASLRGFGSGVVGRNLLEAFAQVAQTDQQFEAWIPSVWGWRNDHLGKRFLLHQVGTGPVWKFYTENVLVRQAVLSGRVDRLFSLGNNGIPLWSCPHLVLVHNPFVAWPESNWTFPTSSGFRRWASLQRAYFRLGQRWVTRFTVQTEHMLRQMRSAWGIPGSIIDIVPSAIENVELPNSTGVTSDIEQQSYICYVANEAPQKNHFVLASLIDALRRRGVNITCKITVRSEDVPLLTAETKRLGLGGQFEFLGPLDVHQSRNLIRGARAFIMPSKLETFGLPYLEAMSLGCPLVVADVECAREVCGKAAQYADPDSGEKFADAVQNVLRSHAESKRWSDLGLARFAEVSWTWDKIASAYLNILNRMQSKEK